MYIESRNRLADIENKLVVTQRGEKAEWKNQLYGINIQITIYKIDKQQGFTV